MNSTASHSTTPAIKGRLTILYSKRDRSGNCYWAFTYEDTATGRTVNGTISGGESNLTAARRYINPEVPGNVSYQTHEMGIREFNRHTKEWGYAGCRPADEIAPFINRELTTTEDAPFQGEP